MRVTVSPAQPNPITAIITKPGHGLTLPVGFPLLAVYVTAGGVITPANASVADSQKVFFITEIVDADTLRAQTTGFIRYDGHGLNIGDYYFVTDTGDGGFSNAPGTVNDISFFVLDTNHLILLDNRPM